MIESVSLGNVYKWPVKLSTVNGAGRWLLITTAAGLPAILRRIRYHNITDTVLSFYDLALVELSAAGTWTSALTGVPVFAGAPATSLVLKKTETVAATEVADSDRGRHGVANSREWLLHDGLYLKPATSYALAHRTAPASHDAVLEIETEEPFA